MARSLYIHFPFCRHLCNYCDFYKKVLTPEENFKQLHQSLEKHLGDVRDLASLHGRAFEGELDTLYLGGGTPSLWGAGGAVFLESFMRQSKLELSGHGEHTMEVDPGSWSDKGISTWRKFGINRFSVGLQSFNKEFVQIMDRAHDLEESIRTLRYFRDLGANFSVDLMLGLPYSKEKKRDTIEELKRILDYGPAHFSVYILKTRKNYPHNENLPDDEYVSDEYLAVSEWLSFHGFHHYEVSNFGLPGKESKHNLKYWDAATVHALGPNATGFLKLSEQKALRYQHKPSGGGISVEKLGAEELLMEEVYLGLRTNRGLPWNKMFRNKNAFVELVDSWDRLGWIAGREDSLVLSPSGYLMIDSIMDDLFRLRLL